MCYVYVGGVSGLLVMARLDGAWGRLFHMYNVRVRPSGCSALKDVRAVRSSSCSVDADKIYLAPLIMTQDGKNKPRYWTWQRRKSEADFVDVNVDTLSFQRVRSSKWWILLSTSRRRSFLCWDVHI